jgi:hypothetical protein
MELLNMWLSVCMLCKEICSYRYVFSRGDACSSSSVNFSARKMRDFYEIVRELTNYSNK